MFLPSVRWVRTGPLDYQIRGFAEYVYICLESNFIKPAAQADFMRYKVEMGSDNDFPLTPQPIEFGQHLSIFSFFIII